MGGQRASALAGWEVRYRDIRLGVVVDVLFDLSVRSLLGFDVRCGDEHVRFLPSRACELAGADVVVSSPFLLIDDGFYRAHAHRLSALTGAPVRQGKSAIGRLVDVIVGDRDNGSATGLVIETADGEQDVRMDGSIAVDAKQLRRAV